MRGGGNSARGNNRAGFNNVQDRNNKRQMNKGRGSFRSGPSKSNNRQPNKFNRGLGGGNKTIVVPFQAGTRVFDGVFIAKGKADALVTRSYAPGETVYGEKRIETVNDLGEKTEYRIWNVFRSKLGAAIIGGISAMPIKPGVKVLYLGAANGTTVSHVSDIVGQDGAVYAVEFSFRSGRDLTNMAKKRPNIVPIIEDARMPWKYRMLVPMVDVIFADVAQPDQSRIVALNASYYLKEGGQFLVSIKASCVDSTISPEAVYAAEINVLRKEKCKTKEQLSLDPYHRDHAIILGRYKASKKNK